MPNSRQTSVIASPSRSRPTNRRRSYMTEHSFHGINTSRPTAKSVTHVSGTVCHLCLRLLTVRRLTREPRGTDAKLNDRPHRRADMKRLSRCLVISLVILSAAALVSGALARGGGRGGGGRISGGAILCLSGSQL